MPVVIMNFSDFKPSEKSMIRVLSVSGIIIVAFFLFLANLKAVGNGISAVIGALAPFIYGIFFALILIPLRNIVENKWLKNVRWKKKTKRKAATAFAMIFMILVLTAFFALVIPELVRSISTFLKNLGGYVNTLSSSLEALSKSDAKTASVIESVFDQVQDYITKGLNGASGGLSRLMNYVQSVINGILDFLIGLIVCVYLLLDTEELKLQSKKFFYAAFQTRIADHIVYICHLTAGMFNKFIFGKAVDSLIIGMICYVCCMVMRMPYAALIAVIVGVTNMIPVFGPFIGAIPCLVILVMIDWVKALEFLIFIIILQQCDGNIIGPYILGDAVGLPTLWVMFAIIVGGALFGIVGMFIGVPAFAVIYTLIKDWSRHRLEEKNIEFPENEEE